MIFLKIVLVFTKIFFCLKFCFCIVIRIRSSYVFAVEFGCYTVFISDNAMWAFTQRHLSRFEYTLVLTSFRQVTSAVTVSSRNNSYTWQLGENTSLFSAGPIRVKPWRYDINSTGIFLPAKTRLIRFLVARARVYLNFALPRDRCLHSITRSNCMKTSRAY